jgi:glycosyltransferase involved in cell wall biosynthesis
VNEATFVESAGRILGRDFIPLSLHCSISKKNRMLRRASIGSMAVAQVRALYAAIRWRALSRADEPLIVRLGVFPIGFACGVIGTQKKFHVKTIGDLDFISRYQVGGFYEVFRKIFNHVHLSAWGYVLKKAHSVDVCTPELRELLSVRFGPAIAKKCTVIPNGVDTVRFNYSTGEDLERRKRSRNFELVLGYFGGRPIERGGLHIIRAVRHLREQGWKALGLVAGGDKPSLVRAADQLGVSDWVTIWDRIPAEEIPPLIRRIDIGIGLDSGWRANVVGNSYQKINQYLACGAGVVMAGTRDAEMASLENVRVVNPEEIDEVIDAIQDLAHRPWQEKARSARQARDFVAETRGGAAIVNSRLDWIEACG